MDLKKDDIIYVLCPDKECKLFFKDINPLPCRKNQFAEIQCACLDKTKFLIFCPNCGEPIILNSNYSSWSRIDHYCHCSIFSRHQANEQRLVYINEPPCENPELENNSPNPFNKGVTLKILSLLKQI